MWLMGLLDPVAEITTFVGTAVDTVAPILTALYGGILGIAALIFGLRFVYRRVRGGF